MHANKDNRIGISRFSYFVQCKNSPNCVCVCMLKEQKEFNSIVRPEIDDLSWKRDARHLDIAFTALLLSLTMALKVFMISSNLDAKTREQDCL